MDIYVGYSNTIHRIVILTFFAQLFNFILFTITLINTHLFCCLIQDIKKSMKKYAANFEVQDKMRYSKASREIIEKRQKQMQTFNDFRKKLIEKVEADKEQRLSLRGG